MDKARLCAFQANYHLIWATKCRNKVLVGPVEVRLVEVLTMFAGRCCFELFAVRVHDGCHVYVFVSVLPKVVFLIWFVCLSVLLLNCCFWSLYR